MLGVELKNYVCFHVLLKLAHLIEKIPANFVQSLAAKNYSLGVKGEQN